jgi:hypothetical protein
MAQRLRRGQDCFSHLTQLSTLPYTKPTADTTYTYLTQATKTFHAHNLGVTSSVHYHCNNMDQKSRVGSQFKVFPYLAFTFCGWFVCGFRSLSASKAFCTCLILNQNITQRSYKTIYALPAWEYEQTGHITDK